MLDGEIVCLDADGRPQFYDLLRRRGEQVFYAFDLLWLDGEDLRSKPLIERKRLLRSIMPVQPSVVLYAEHVERTGPTSVCQEAEVANAHETLGQDVQKEAPQELDGGQSHDLLLAATLAEPRPYAKPQIGKWIVRMRRDSPGAA